MKSDNTEWVTHPWYASPESRARDKAILALWFKCAIYRQLERQKKKRERRR